MLKKLMNELIGLGAQLQELLLEAAKHTDPPHRKGYQFQKWFAQECRNRGMRVRRKKTGSSHVDLIANGKRVQCKHFTPLQSGLVYVQPGRSSYYSPKDFDVLAMRCDETLYLIPIEALPITKKGHIAKQTYPNQFAQFVDAWHVLGDYTHEVEEQGLLFSHEVPHGR